MKKRQGRKAYDLPFLAAWCKKKNVKAVTVTKYCFSFAPAETNEPWWQKVRPDWNFIHVQNSTQGENRQQYVATSGNMPTQYPSPAA